MQLKKKILIAITTVKLGSKIVDVLLVKEIEVKGIVLDSNDKEKIVRLKK